MTREFVPEPFCTDEGQRFAPRRLGERRLWSLYAYELQGEPVVAAKFQRGWVRPVESDDPCVSDYPARPNECGRTCGCFIVCGSRDPRRAQPVWWLP